MPFTLNAIGDSDRKKGALAHTRSSDTRALESADRLRSVLARVVTPRPRRGRRGGGKPAPALGHHEAARGAAQLLGSGSWTGKTRAAAEKVRRKLEAETRPRGSTTPGEASTSG